MRKLYLVRHAAPNFKDGVKLCIGRTDIDIGERGIYESKNLKDFFSNKNISCIYSSPLSRCVSTSKIISGGSIEIKTDNGLAEIDMGSWEGVPLKNIIKELGDEPIDGERRIDALKRFENTILNIMSNSVGDIICLGHAGVNCAFIAKVIGSDIRISRSIKQPYASYNLFEFSEGEFKCLKIGIVP